MIGASWRRFRRDRLSRVLSASRDSARHPHAIKISYVGGDATLPACHVPTPATNLPEVGLAEFPPSDGGRTRPAVPTRGPRDRGPHRAGTPKIRRSWRNRRCEPPIATEGDRREKSAAGRWSEGRGRIMAVIVAVVAGEGGNGRLHALSEDGAVGHRSPSRTWPRRSGTGSAMRRRAGCGRRPRRSTRGYYAPGYGCRAATIWS
jgi:hypothetical protein